MKVEQYEPNWDFSKGLLIGLLTMTLLLTLFELGYLLRLLMASIALICIIGINIIEKIK